MKTENISQFLQTYMQARPNLQTGRIFYDVRKDCSGSLLPHSSMFGSGSDGQLARRLLQ